MDTNAPKKSIRTRRAIVNLLKQQGATDAQDLAAHLGISAMAVRQHLYALQEEQLVAFTEDAREMGRPAKLWQLTPAADRLFPDGYADLTLTLINAVTEAFGAAGLDQLLDVRMRHQLDDYRAAVPNQAPLAETLAVLAALRTEEGYMAEIKPLEDGSFLLIENHCPICAAATVCPGLCAREQDTFQAILGENVAINRVEHMVSGARRCVYHVGLRLPH